MSYAATRRRLWGASMLGTVIGNYRLLRQLGEGGMGVVYLAEHTLLGRRAAIKVLLPSLSARPDVITRFFNEARAATSIGDPGIVQVFDFGQHTDGSAFLVMELLDGEPLDRRLGRHHHLPPAEALRVGRQIATTLGAAHDKGIIHRDLKPENVFLVRDPEVAGGERAKVLDFGIAKLTGGEPNLSKTQTGALMGTPIYMSPEQCLGAANLDHRSDIYALGCVLHHLLTGRPPFVSGGLGELLGMHMIVPAPAPSTHRPELGPDLDALVLRCLAKRPADRFQTMTEVAAAIDELLAGLAPLGAGGWRTPVPPAPDPVGDLATRSRTPTTLGSASVAASAPPEAVAPARRRAGIVKVGAALAAITLGGAAWLLAAGPRDRDAAPAPTVAAPTDVSASTVVVDAGVDAGVDGSPDAAAVEDPSLPSVAGPVPVAPTAPASPLQRHERHPRRVTEPATPPPAEPTAPPPPPAHPACKLDEHGVPVERC